MYLRRPGRGSSLSMCAGVRACVCLYVCALYACVDTLQLRVSVRVRAGSRDTLPHLILELRDRDVVSTAPRRRRLRCRPLFSRVARCALTDANCSRVLSPRRRRGVPVFFVFSLFSFLLGPCRPGFHHICLNLPSFYSFLNSFISCFLMMHNLAALHYTSGRRGGET